MNKKVKNVVIAGGGTAGWMCAAALSRLLGRSINVTLIESDAIGTIGVGEATIPPIRNYHRLLKINEAEFMKATQATFKLGIQFENWKQQGSNYIHSFGATGKECWAGEFHHFWLRAIQEGMEHDFGDFCLELEAARQERFSNQSRPVLNFAYHFDASRYAQFLRKLSEANGVNRIEGKITCVDKHNDSGFIEALYVNEKQRITGDLFIDCTGFSGLLIEKSLHTGFDDWSHWLLCDSAIAVQTESAGDASPYTRSIAHPFGWQWHIPLQHRVGNGLVFSSQYADENTARETLMSNIEGKPLTEPRLIKFKTGKRRRAWNKNCIALGLSSAFVEPLESTSIHLVMTGIVRLMRLFPFDGIYQSLIDEYNTKFDSELRSIRDFILLHYAVTQRDEPFWAHFRSITLPDSLQHKIALFKETARVYIDDGDIFRTDSWTQVMLGQGIMPQTWHRIADEMSVSELRAFINSIRDSVKGAVTQLPGHQHFVDSYLK